MAYDRTTGDDPARPAGGVDTRAVQRLETPTVERAGPTPDTRAADLTRDRDDGESFRDLPAQRAPDLDRSLVGRPVEHEKAGLNTDMDGASDSADDETVRKSPDRMPGDADHEAGDIGQAAKGSALDMVHPGASLAVAVGEKLDKGSHGSSDKPAENQQQQEAGGADSGDPGDVGGPRPPGYDGPSSRQGEHGHQSEHGEHGQHGQHGEHGERHPGPADGGAPRMSGEGGTEHDMLPSGPGEKGQQDEHGMGGTEVDQPVPEDQKRHQDGDQPGSGSPENYDPPSPPEKKEVPSSEQPEGDSPAGGLVDRILGTLTDSSHDIEYRDGMAIIRVDLKDGTGTEISIREARGPTEGGDGSRPGAPEAPGGHQESRHENANEESRHGDTNEAHEVDDD
jgi:hypothetical protein